VNAASALGVLTEGVVHGVEDLLEVQLGPLLADEAGHDDLAVEVVDPARGSFQLHLRECGDLSELLRRDLDAPDAAFALAKTSQEHVHLNGAVFGADLPEASLAIRDAQHDDLEVCRRLGLDPADGILLFGFQQDTSDEEGGLGLRRDLLSDLLGRVDDLHHVVRNQGRGLRGSGNSLGGRNEGKASLGDCLGQSGLNCGHRSTPSKRKPSAMLGELIIPF
jgi:hypothetical protein